MKKNKHLALPLLWLIVNLTSMSAMAQESESVLDRLANAGVEIRKSFTGSSKDAGAPASITYENPDQGADFYSIDMGIKIGAYLEDEMSRGAWGGRLYPALEIHRSTKETEKIRKNGGSLTLELERAFGPDNDEERFDRMLFIDGKFELNKDSQLHETTRTTTLRVGWYDVTHRNGPANDIVFGTNDSISFRWLVTAGAEDYRKLPIKAKINGETVLVAEAVDTTVGFGRINVLLKPFRNALDAKLGITSTYTIRRNISGDDFFGKTTRLTEVSVDYFLDEQNRFALGFSYQDGRDPTRNFLDEEFSSVGLKLKLQK